MVFSLPDDQLFVVRVQALFLSTTNKAPGDLSSTTLISQKLSSSSLSMESSRLTCGGAWA